MKVYPFLCVHWGNLVTCVYIIIQKKLMMEINDNKPMSDEKEVAKSNDEKINQDFPGFPNLPATKEIIKPGNKKEEKDAGLELNESTENPENNVYGPKKNMGTEEIQSDGSAGAFDATENVQEDADSNNYIRNNK